MLCRRIDPSGHRCRPVYISEVKTAQVQHQMGAAIEREATAVLKDAEQLARVDTIEELVALLVFTVIAVDSNMGPLPPRQRARLGAFQR